MFLAWPSWLGSDTCPFRSDPFRKPVSVSGTFLGKAKLRNCSFQAIGPVYASIFDAKGQTYFTRAVPELPELPELEFYQLNIFLNYEKRNEKRKRNSLKINF